MILRISREPSTELSYLFDRMGMRCRQDVESVVGREPY